MSFDADNVGENMRRNMFSNYIVLALRTARGLVLFRLLYEAFSAEQFGYWSLLWSVFGFGIVLDFGFGLTIQRSVVRLTADKAWTQLNQSLSTILFLYCGIGVLLGLLGALGAESWLRWVNVTDGSRTSFRAVFLWFIAAMALKFPLTVFSEILRAQQRIALLNWITIWTNLVGLVLILVALKFDWGFVAIAQIALAETQVPAVIAAYFAYRYTPTLRLRPSLFAVHELRSAAKFSLVAYLIMLTYMASTKTDLLVISTMLSLQAAAGYQPGAKVAEMFALVAKQLPDALQSASGHLYAKGDHAGLQRLQRTGVRFTAIIATPLCIGCAFYMPWLISILTGTHEADSTMIAVGRALLVWAYGYVVAQDVYKRIALMSGQEKRLMWSGLAETACNIGLSVLFVLLGWGLLGVVLGTLIPATVLSLLFFWRWAARQAGETYAGLIRGTLLRTWLANAPLAVLLLVGQLLGLLSPAAGLLGFTLFLLLAGVTTLVSVWLSAWEPEERVLVVQRLPQALRRALSARSGARSP